MVHQHPHIHAKPAPDDRHGYSHLPIIVNDNWIIAFINLFLYVCICQYLRIEGRFISLSHLPEERRIIWNDKVPVFEWFTSCHDEESRDEFFPGHRAHGNGEVQGNEVQLSKSVEIAGKLEVDIVDLDERSVELVFLLICGALESDRICT